MANTLVVIGCMGLKRAYLNVNRTEALRRFVESDGEFGSEYVDEFEFEDEFLAYDIWQLENKGPDKDEWQDNRIQYPRLLTECEAVLETEQIAEIAVSMDLTTEQVCELFDRAEAEFETIKDADMEAQGHQYEVIVGNIGTVYSGPDVVMARQHYKEYVEQSTSNYGRAAGEQVTLMQDDEPIEEYHGTLNEESDEDD